MMRSAAGFDCACKNSDELAHINIDKATVKKALVRRRVVFIRLWSSVEGSSSEFELPNLCDRFFLNTLVPPPARPSHCRETTARSCWGNAIKLFGQSDRP